MLENKTILITGGTGSLGKTLVNRILSGEHGIAKKVIVFSRDEAKQHQMRLEYLHRKVSTDEVIYDNFKRTLEFRIGDVRDYTSIQQAMRHVDIVINAAALKHVPVCEYFPEQAVMTNCLGAENIVKAVNQNADIQTVVGVSTDKACKPVNVMGMTKAIQERIFIAAAVLNKDTRFICVRYGNVLSSRGSVIPLFHDQIQNGGPVTITSKEMTRFLLSLNQAVDTILFALSHGKTGELIIPQAPAARIIDLAKILIDEKKHIKIQVVGTRPGEKMHEIMISEEEIKRATKRGDFFVISAMLNELNNDNYKHETPVNLSGEYASNTTVMTSAEIRSLLETHQLLSPGVEERELLR